MTTRSCDDSLTQSLHDAISDQCSEPATRTPVQGANVAIAPKPPCPANDACETCQRLCLRDIEAMAQRARNALLLATRDKDSARRADAAVELFAVEHVRASVARWRAERSDLSGLAARESGHDTEGPLPDAPIPYRLADGHDLVPAGALAAVARVFLHGARKHSPHGWREITRGYHYGKAAGHMHEYLRDVTVDADSGEHPLAHAVARLLMVLALELEAGEP